MEDGRNSGVGGQEWERSFAADVRSEVVLEEQKEASSLFSRIRKRKKLLIAILSIAVVLVGGCVVVLPNLFVRAINFEIDERAVRTVVYDPIYGDRIRLKVGDAVGYSIVANVKALAIFANCTYDSSVIDLIFGRIVAKTTGEAEIVCASSLNGSVGTKPIKIEVYE